MESPSEVREHLRRVNARARLLVHVVRRMRLPMIVLVARNTVRRERSRRREVRDRAMVGPGHPPGKLVRADPQPSGARFVFARATLEVRFLAADVLRVSWEPGTAPVPYAIASPDATGPTDAPSPTDATAPADATGPTDAPFPAEAAPADAAASAETANSSPEPTAPSLCLLDRGGAWDLLSELLNLRVSAEGATVLSRRDGTVLRRAEPPAYGGGRWCERIEMRPGERFSGLGEQAAGVDLRGGRYRLWNTDAGGNWATGHGPLYMGIPVVVGTHPEGDVLTFYENSTHGTFVFGDLDAPRGEPQHVSVEFAGGQLRAYLVAGPLPRLLDCYSALTGRPSLPPRWALGYHQSRWGYDSEAQVREVLAGYTREGVPLSAVHLDIDYMDGYRIFTVDRRRFPDLPALSADLSAHGVRLVTIVDPGVKVDPGYDVYRQGQALSLFCRDRAGRTTEGVVWPGRTAFPDFTDPRTRAWWGDHYRTLIDAGVHGVWHDMNEPSSISLRGDPTLPLDTRHDFDGRGGDHGEAHNLYGLLMNRAGYEGMALARPDRRPFILSRSGWAGEQRWAWNWTGDAESSWTAMRQQVATIVGMGLSGVPFSGSDTGGFSGVPDDELYLRWLQMSVFMGFCRTHSIVGAPPREPWRFGEPTRSLVGSWTRFRYRLLPYLYTLAHEAVASGAPLVRPVWWPTPEGPDAGSPVRALGDVDDEFLLGDALLVAPVCEPGATGRALALPPGSWRSLWAADPDEVLTGSSDGGTTTWLRAPTARLPVLVRAGTILPLDDGFAEASGPCAIDGDPFGDHPATGVDLDHAPRRLTFHCWPAADGSAEGHCADDAGDGDGPVRLDGLRLDGARPGADAVLTWRRRGPFPPPSRVRVVLHDMEAEEARADGESVGATRGGAVECTPFDRLELGGLRSVGERR